MRVVIIGDLAAGMSAASQAVVEALPEILPWLPETPRARSPRWWPIGARRP
ncbi:hypothetical protein [Thiocapsa marina]|uniref:Uncharacterized protein n=1 Tax=Thiocapsa marina 5811 TaxID=768671 RepID=F9UD35_9GAMM|nr:hypothetical protein [Thiocapsa marina]EGV17779.1 hypothetical protein ThimaDRAFT_2838 [Thiocapsa marina 5811]